jgi:D-alanyl-D-alanine carboxypeptidase
LPLGIVGRALTIVGLVAGLAGVVGTDAGAAPNAAIVVDAKTGKVLYADEPDARRHPASLTKMMTLYMLFEAIDSRRIGLRTDIGVSQNCARKPPSKLGFKPSQTIEARDAILALVTKSANDVACAVGELLGGSESAFAQQMTERARRLGMNSTVFRNASGLPDSAQVTTARDMATLGRALQSHFPGEFKYFKTKSFKWKGYTRASGYNLVCSARRGRREIIAVVLGGDTGKARDARMTALLEEYLPGTGKGFRLFGRR